MAVCVCEGSLLAGSTSQFSKHIGRQEPRWAHVSRACPCLKRTRSPVQHEVLRAACPLQQRGAGCWTKRKTEETAHAMYPSNMHDRIKTMRMHVRPCLPGLRGAPWPPSSMPLRRVIRGTPGYSASGCTHAVCTAHGRFVEARITLYHGGCCKRLAARCAWCPR